MSDIPPSPLATPPASQPVSRKVLQALANQARPAEPPKPAHFDVGEKVTVKGVQFRIHAISGKRMYLDLIE
jgi:hypothetical protein